VVGTAAGLRADERTRELAPDWEALERRVADERQARDAARRRTVESRARLRIVDARWDVLVRDLSEKSLALSGSASSPPHSLLFDTVTAREARDFGSNKAGALGEPLVATLREIGNAEIAPFAARLTAINAELNKAASERKEAEEAEAAFDLRRRRLTEDIETQVAKTEVALLQRLARRRRLVAAVLSPAERP